MYFFNASLLTVLVIIVMMELPRKARSTPHARRQWQYLGLAGKKGRE